MLDVLPARIHEQPVGGVEAYLKALVASHPEPIEIRTGAGRIFFDLMDRLPSFPRLEEWKTELCHLITDTVYPLAANLAARGVTLTLTAASAQLSPPASVEDLSTYIAFDSARGVMRSCFLSQHEKFADAALMSIPEGLTVLCKPLYYHYHRLHEDRQGRPRHPAGNLPNRVNRANDRPQDWEEYDAERAAVRRPADYDITAPMPPRPAIIEWFIAEIVQPVAAFIAAPLAAILPRGPGPETAPAPIPTPVSAAVAAPPVAGAVEQIIAPAAPAEHPVQPIAPREILIERPAAVAEAAPPAAAPAVPEAPAVRAVAAPEAAAVQRPAVVMETPSAPAAGGASAAPRPVEAAAPPEAAPAQRPVAVAERAEVFPPASAARPVARPSVQAAAQIHAPTVQEAPRAAAFEQPSGAAAPAPAQIAAAEREGPPPPPSQSAAPPLPQGPPASSGHLPSQMAAAKPVETPQSARPAQSPPVQFASAETAHAPRPYVRDEISPAIYRGEGVKPIRTLERQAERKEFEERIITPHVAGPHGASYAAGDFYKVKPLAHEYWRKKLDAEQNVRYVVDKPELHTTPTPAPGPALKQAPGLKRFLRFFKIPGGSNPFDDT